MFFSRKSYLNQLISHKNNGMIKIISGLRRCGKSYLLNTIFKSHLLSEGVKEDHIISIDLDDVQFKNLHDGLACYNYVKSFLKDHDMYYLLLDEVQMMSDFESVLNGFLHISNIDVYVSGSNSKFLSKDVVTEFRGRGDEIRVYPLTLSELYEASNIQSFDEVFKQYIVFGGMPKVYSFNTIEEKQLYLKNLVNETYLKDLIARHHLKDSNPIQNLLLVLASNIGALNNPNKLSNTFKSDCHIDISAPTLTSYIDYMQDAFLIRNSYQYDIKGKKYLSSPYKSYFTDLGIRNALLDFRQVEKTHLLENLIYNELITRGYSVDVGKVFLLEKLDNGYQKKSREVDFVVNKMNRRYYIQSALSLPSKEKLKQETASLCAIDDFFKKIIITSDTVLPYQDEKGLIFMGLEDFILDKNSLNLF